MARTLLIDLGAVEDVDDAGPSGASARGAGIPTSFSDDDLYAAVRRLAEATRELLDEPGGSALRRRTCSEPRLRPRPEALPPLLEPISPTAAIASSSFSFASSSAAAPAAQAGAGSPSGRRRILSSLGALSLSGIGRARSAGSMAPPSPPSRSSSSSPAVSASSPGPRRGSFGRSGAPPHARRPASPLPAVTLSPETPERSARAPAHDPPPILSPTPVRRPLPPPPSAAAALPPARPSPVPSPEPLEAPSPGESLLGPAFDARDRSGSLNIAAAAAHRAVEPLPHRRTSAPAVAQRAEAPRACACGFAVLVADDEAVNRLIAGRVFSAAALGPDALTDIVNDGRAAVDSFRRALAGRPYDAVVLDLDMPRLGGFEAAQAMRAAERAAGTRPARIVGWSAALTSCALRARCLATAFDEALAKPCPHAILLSRVLSALPHGPTCPVPAQLAPLRPPAPAPGPARPPS